uniref:Uncharacterized protein n=1 Tax=Rhizophora mucronata TaxID=61149 RepID=A0A2P2NYJ3_RHIMU
MSFKASCLALNILWRTCCEGVNFFIACFTIILVDNISSNKRGIMPLRTREGTNITPFGLTSILSFKSWKIHGSGENELTPSVFIFEGATFPRHVQKQRLYAIIIDG